MTMERKIRVLLGKGSADGHTVGLILVARALMDAGMEVIFLGIFQEMKGIVQAASDEDVDVIGINQLDGDHMWTFTKIAQLIKQKGLDDVLFIGGGCIPPYDIEELKKYGVDEIFPTGSSMDEIIDYIRNNVRKR